MLFRSALVAFVIINLWFYLLRYIDVSRINSRPNGNELIAEDNLCEARNSCSHVLLQKIEPKIWSVKLWKNFGHVWRLGTKEYNVRLCKLHTARNKRAQPYRPSSRSCSQCYLQKSSVHASRLLCKAEAKQTISKQFNTVTEWIIRTIRSKIHWYEVELN